VNEALSAVGAWLELSVTAAVPVGAILAVPVPDPAIVLTPVAVAVDEMVAVPAVGLFFFSAHDTDSKQASINAATNPMPSVRNLLLFIRLIISASGWQVKQVNAAGCCIWLDDPQRPCQNQVLAGIVEQCDRRSFLSPGPVRISRGRGDAGVTGKFLGNLDVLGPPVDLRDERVPEQVRSYREVCVERAPQC
jgi:hypothetical protein